MMSWPLAWSSFRLRILRFGKCYKSLRKKKKWKLSKRTCSKVPIANTMEMIHMVHSGLPTLGFLFPYSEAGEASIPSMVIFSLSPNQLNWRCWNLKPFSIPMVFSVLIVSQKQWNFTMSQKWRWAADDIGMKGHFQLVTDIFREPIFTISRSSKPLEDGDAFDQAPYECQLFHEGLFICLSYRRQHGILRLLWRVVSWPARCSCLLESALSIYPPWN